MIRGPIFGVFVFVLSSDRSCCLFGFTAVAFQSVCGNAVDTFHMRLECNRMLCVRVWVMTPTELKLLPSDGVCVVCCSITVIILFCACFQSKLIYVCFQLYLSTYGLMDW